jgi:hypothetical protein
VVSACSLPRNTKYGTIVFFQVTVTSEPKTLRRIVRPLHQTTENQQFRKVSTYCRCRTHWHDQSLGTLVLENQHLELYINYTTKASSQSPLVSRWPCLVKACVLLDFGAKSAIPRWYYELAHCRQAWGGGSPSTAHPGKETSGALMIQQSFQQDRNRIGLRYQLALLAAA